MTAYILHKDNSHHTKREGCEGCFADRLEAERDALRSMVERYREVLEEVALPPYHDSDFASLLETFRTRAKAALSEDGGKGFMGTDLDFKDF